VKRLTACVPLLRVVGLVWLLTGALTLQPLMHGQDTDTKPQQDAGVITAAVEAPATKGKDEGVTPQQLELLYDQVWNIINSKFLDSRTNGQAWTIWRKRYDNKLQTPKDLQVAVDTMLESLGDHYTRFLNTEDFAEENQSIQATLSGIGIQIGVKNDRIVVIAPIEDTPADRAGLKTNDIILSIDGTSTRGMSVKDAAKLIRGKKGTAVKLVVNRPDPDTVAQEAVDAVAKKKKGQPNPDKTPKALPDKPGKTFSVAVVRDDIKLKSVSTEHPFKLAVPATIGYIKLSSFLSQEATAEVEQALEKMGDKKGYVIDLRSNPGGLVSNALRIADMFLANGAIVSTVDRDGYKQTWFAQPGVVTDKPLVILIDPGSASASEILSGALRDNHRALLVGQKSFGKGLVQEINPLLLGNGLNITIQKYLTPDNTDINLTGIQPDLSVPMKPENIEKKQDPQFLAALQTLEDLISGKQTVKLFKATQAAKRQQGNDNGSAAK
jgi:carboxyl-terminal processing protease